MRRIWDAIAAIIITAMVVRFLLGALKPYVPFLALSLVIYIAAMGWYRKAQRW